MKCLFVALRVIGWDLQRARRHVVHTVMHQRWITFRFLRTSWV
ncbi:hypothetical protein HMPREF0970_01292 [Schaalia odontolytica F0309]|uniref:Uncharacterized protein n=1 Tax=Schaalia odontolytica F0309 TaxID=649742 RepID=D4TZB1_9ACTO|nr:hypothetical protein HMPREF0970_01292 [Schaalia odontolytica F0309]